MFWQLVVVWRCACVLATSGGVEVCGLQAYVSETKHVSKKMKKVPSSNNNKNNEIQRLQVVVRKEDGSHWRGRQLDDC